MNIEALNSVAVFSECVGEPDDVLELRLLKEGGSPKSYWHRAKDIENQAAALAEMNADGFNVYVGANPRRQHGGSTADDVSLARCLFIDIDGGCTEAEAKKRIASAKLPFPTMLISSGGGVHAYWRLWEPITDLGEFTRLQKKLIAATGADKSIHDAPRIMRLPGFLNVKKKYPEPLPCRILAADAERRFDVAEVVGHLPDVTKLDTPPATNGTPQSAGVTDLVRAAAWLDKKPNVGEGERNNAAFSAAAAMVKDFNLSDSEAKPLLARWNQGNNPPLDDTELDAVLRSARLHGTHAPGQKLSERNGSSYQHNGTTPIGNKADRPHGTAGESHHTWDQIGPPLSLGEMKTQFPKLPEAVIHGLLRVGETMNVIAASKIGKSWLVYLVALCIATGKRLFDRFGTVRGNVLIIDNELFPEVSAHRLPLVAAKLGISPEDCDGNLFMVNLRGRLLDIHGIAAWLRKHVKPGQFKVIIIDAYYRILPEDIDENGNGPITQVYNQIDAIGRELNAAIILVHHASKGSQSSKAVIDVGAGAGAQSRAADTHFVLRPHEEPGVAVADAVVRSWEPVEPFCLMFDFPLWKVADAHDPALLKSDKPKTTVNQTADKVWDCLKEAGPLTRNLIRAKLQISGDKVNQAVEVLLTAKRIEPVDVKTKSGMRVAYQVIGTTDTTDSPGLSGEGATTDGHLRGCPVRGGDWSEAQSELSVVRGGE